jgi:hypothetical protein
MHELEVNLVAFLQAADSCPSRLIVLESVQHSVRERLQMIAMFASVSPAKL